MACDHNLKIEQIKQDDLELQASLAISRVKIQSDYATELETI